MTQPGPIQFNTFSELQERQMDPFKKWQRWPWVITRKESAVPPPWIDHTEVIHLTDWNKALRRCLVYLLENLAHVPKRSPVLGWSKESHKKCSPLRFSVNEIKGNIKEIKEARCSEVLGFCLCLSGLPVVDEIRRLLSVPTGERIAEAYVVSCGPVFLTARVGFIGSVSEDMKETFTKMREEENKILVLSSIQESELSDVDAQLAKAIREKPGIQGKELAEITKCKVGNVRKRFEKESPLNKLGFHRTKGGQGYRPPKV